MINIIVMGHGGYAEGIRKNLEMLSGVPQQMHFLDLTEEGLPQLEEKLNALLDTLGDQEILYACDLLGASPFRVAALVHDESPKTSSGHGAQHHGLCGTGPAGSGAVAP
jgi:PTS system N-acetylgalactosamine-specific IIA component